MTIPARSVSHRKLNLNDLAAGHSKELIRQQPELGLLPGLFKDLVQQVTGQLPEALPGAGAFTGGNVNCKHHVASITLQALAANLCGTAWGDQRCSASSFRAQKMLWLL